MALAAVALLPSIWRISPTPAPSRSISRGSRRAMPRPPSLGRASATRRVRPGLLSPTLRALGLDQLDLQDAIPVRGLPGGCFYHRREQYLLAVLPVLAFSGDLQDVPLHPQADGLLLHPGELGDDPDIALFLQDVHQGLPHIGHHRPLPAFPDVAEVLNDGLAPHPHTHGESIDPPDLAPV